MLDTFHRACLVTGDVISWQAVEALEGATRVQPVAPLFMLLGKTQMKAQSWKDAVESFQKAVEAVVSNSTAITSILYFLHLLFLLCLTFVLLGHHQRSREIEQMVGSAL